MRRTTTTYASASAAVLCLGVLLTGCAGAAEEGYAAVGAAGPADGHAPVRPVPPRDGVELTPLDGHEAATEHGTREGGDRDGGATRPDRPAPTPGSSPGPSDSAAPSPPSGTDGTPAPNSPSPSGTSAPSHDSPAPKPPSPTVPAGPGAPAGLLVGKPGLADTDVRWCEKVRIDFLNTGDRSVTSGTVTFGSHVIGALGIDWATLTSSHRLPLPLAPGERKAGTWRVCVDAWRVPMGMHLDTKDVAFVWK
ncbi:hypothetical protein [Streptomyces sp. NPDC050355]|uniref:hypothetical protein n=1 Tax=Streptomyces sp. NPDC050355 TaxID=3365609 RepID=UPI003787A62C